MATWEVSTVKRICHSIAEISVSLGKFLGGFSHAPDELLTYGVDMKMIRFDGILQGIIYVVMINLLLAKNSFLILVGGYFGDLSKRWSKQGSFTWPLLYIQVSLSALEMGVFSLIVYSTFMYGIYVPNWHFTIHNKDSDDYGKVFSVTCRVRGKLDPPCNAMVLINISVLGINHMYQDSAWRRSKGPLRKDAPSWCHAPFELEGILSSISSFLSTIIRAHFGHVLIYLKGHSDRLKHWVIMGLFFLVLGLILHFIHAIPLNKQLYTFSYVCVTSRTTALVFTTIYILICRVRKKCQRFLVCGLPCTVDEELLRPSEDGLNSLLSIEDLHALISPVPQGTPLPLVLLGKNKERAELLGWISLFCWMGSSICSSLIELGELGRLSVSMEKLEKELKNGDKCQVCLT
ncbi:hypothetical protein SLEP1_g50053 [Rubroshorea leprosula]|uniref:Gustatory receptor n=1 Tax=Rubroshorea leprosula TaxID=152421 RepID=A0AAV5LZK8_9ROSI|nr:hypothetical protein SLEP1_g50053 [Rubroshorea leprosula]